VEANQGDEMKRLEKKKLLKDSAGVTQIKDSAGVTQTEPRDNLGPSVAHMLRAEEESWREWKRDWDRVRLRAGKRE